MNYIISQNGLCRLPEYQDTPAVLLPGERWRYLCIRDKGMTVWDAIHEMRERSAKGESFSFTFMSCNTSGRYSEGVTEVLHGRLLSRESKAHHKDADFVERYLNLDTMEARHFYQPLLMTYEGQKVNLT